MIGSFHFFLLILWIVYSGLHSILASARFKCHMQKVLGKNFSYYRLLYSCFAAITLLLLLNYQFKHQSIIILKQSWPLMLPGTFGVLGGAAIMIICIRKYFLNLSGVDVLMKKRLEPVLEKGGLHSYIRHPLYSGTLLFIWSVFLISPLLSNLIASTVITIYTLIGIRMEEKKLIDEFGDEYRMYARQTPMLIPFLKSRMKAL